jgi:hypothetical protein
MQQPDAAETALSVTFAMISRSKLEISTCFKRPRCSMMRASLRARNSSGV